MDEEDEEEIGYPPVKTEVGSVKKMKKLMDKDAVGEKDEEDGSIDEIDEEEIGEEIDRLIKKMVEKKILD